MGAKARQLVGGIGPRELELDELVEAREALVAGDPVLEWAKHTHVRATLARRSEVSRERPAHLRPGAVEEHTLVRRRDSQLLADLIRVPAHDVAQGDDRSLCRRQRRGRSFDDCDRLVRE
jgi:hypothetical protein